MAVSREASVQSRSCRAAAGRNHRSRCRPCTTCTHGLSRRRHSHRRSRTRTCSSTRPIPAGRVAAVRGPDASVVVEALVAWMEETVVMVELAVEREAAAAAGRHRRTAHECRSPHSPGMHCRPCILPHGLHHHTLHPMQKHRCSSTRSLGAVPAAKALAEAEADAWRASGMISRASADENEASGLALGPRRRRLGQLDLRR